MTQAIMSLAEAQHDMRQAYYGGATGAFCSATAWLAAALVAFMVNPRAGIVTLVVAGMLIFPASMVLSKILGRPGAHSKNNPLASLAIEGTVWMILSIVVAIGVAFYRLEWFFPAMLLVIGGRYFTFATLYGMKVYWLFAVTLAICALPLLALQAPVYAGALAGSVIEFSYAIVIFAQCRPARRA